MTEEINVEVGVIVIFLAGEPNPLPWKVKWRKRYFTFKQVDLCHPVWEGKTIQYVFSVSNGTSYYRLDYNTR
ncbi:hypothetical protein HJC99_01835 [Candidatus Saccharibacteria bacterium]|nr:hypothetical protein [Candidatus Saccharibacteria bacterium]